MNDNGDSQTTMIPQRPEMTSRWREASPEDIEANRIILRRQYQELHDQQQGPCATKVIWITCRCGKKITLMHAYRCLYCGIWFCKDCAEDHFAEQEASA